VLVRHLRQWVEAGPGPARKNDAFHGSSYRRVQVVIERLLPGAHGAGLRVHEHRVGRGQAPSRRGSRPCPGAAGTQRTPGSLGEGGDAHEERRLGADCLEPVVDAGRDADEDRVLLADEELHEPFVGGGVLAGVVECDLHHPVDAGEVVGLFLVVV